VHSPRDLVRVMQVPVLAVLPSESNPLLAQRRTRMLAIALIGGALLIACIVGALHAFYMPIDVAWYGMMRRLGN
jgi:hypothetical protein